MKTRILALGILLMFTGFVSGQSEITYSGTVVKSGYANNESYGPFNTGFDFTYFGNIYNQFYVSSNGLVSFGAGSIDPSEDPIPTAATPNNMIAAFWDDLVIDPSGNILYTTIGAAPNRKLIVQFKNMGFYSGPVYVGTFSVILYETSNKIQVQYRVIILPSIPLANGESASIGIENSDGTAGVQYAHHNGAAANTGKAISFTPSGATYTMDDNALYDGVYLTTNITLPDPGITALTSPTENAIIGTSHTFEWDPSPYAANYSLRISPNSNLSGAISYDAGTNLSYDVTGLTEGTTYYWGVFASNATGTTWCEIRKFTTSSTPPLAAVPLTIWAEQGQDKTIKLNYTGGDASPKTAIVTSLPAQGTLYQYNAGARGAQITAVPATVTDANRNVIYASSGSAGNGVGNFNFKINDGTGDSPEATITVNVSPPGIPAVLYTAKNTNVEIQFDRTMSDPSGKQAQFTVQSNGTPVTINSAALKAGDPNTIVLNLATPLTGTETVLVSYTQGDVTATTGGFLLSFNNLSVTLTAQTITWTQSLDRKYSLTPFALTATASGGSGMTYSSSNPAVATIAGSSCTLKGLGPSEITARQAGNATHAPAKFTRTLTVNKGDQTITFGPIPQKAVGDEDFNLTATASSGLPVSFSSSDPAVATVTGTLVHIVGAGTTVITASQAGSTLWNQAPDVPQNLTVIITGIEDQFAAEKSFSIYSRDNMIIIRTLEEEWDGKTGTVKLFDIAGKPVRIMRNTEFSRNSQIEVPVGNVKGLYVVEIRSGAMKVTRKVVVR